MRVRFRFARVRAASVSASGSMARSMGPSAILEAVTSFAKTLLTGRVSQMKVSLRDT